MPTFDFECSHPKACGHKFEEFLLKHTDESPRCPKCGAKTNRLIGTPGFHFADGSGTDMGELWRYAGKAGNRMPPT